MTVSTLGDGVSNAVQDVLDNHPQRQSALLAILHDVPVRCEKESDFDTMAAIYRTRDAYRCDEATFPGDAVGSIAAWLNLSRAEVHGVISFYHFFRTRPGGKRTLFLCRAEACQSMGARALQDHLETAHGLKLHEQSEDGRFTLEPVYCLGNCACAPAVMVDRELIGRVDADTLDRLLAADIK